MTAEIALLDDRHEGIDISGIVGTRGETIFTTDATMFVDDDDPVLLFPGRLDWAIDDTRRMLALITEGGEKVACDVGVPPLFNNLHP